jgi:hypothetical protein
LIAPSQDYYVAKSHNNVVSGSMNSSVAADTMNFDRRFVVSMNWGEPLASSVVEKSDVRSICTTLSTKTVPQKPRIPLASPLALVIQSGWSASLFDFGSVPFRGDPPPLRGLRRLHDAPWLWCCRNGSNECFQFFQAVVDIFGLIPETLAA